ncbi:MAG TPA: hypothetical protein VGI05_19700 [Streptosporangiaceae bacterium]|jgi:hypothetical protein
MSNKWVDLYRREWPRVAAVQAMALGGASLLAAGRKRNTPAHLFRRLIQSPDHLRAELCSRSQILASLPCRIQPRHRLIQIRPRAPRQTCRRHQLR